MVFTGLW